LDSIPHPSRDIFWNNPRETYLFSSRGCPYRCKFCSSSRFWGKVRLFSAEYVVEELDEVRRRGAKFVNFYDDTFLIDIKRTRKIKEMIKGFDIKFAVAARANQITDEAVEILKEMNVVVVGMGLESNSAKILEWLEKGNTPEINQRAVDILTKHKMRFGASFIIDTPVETKEDLKITFDFIKKNKISYDMYHLVKFPNTPLYDGNTDWDACTIRYYYPSFRKRAKNLLLRTKIVPAIYRPLRDKIRSLRREIT
jgi:radical SAM superfamily enzyme YgiQ (UPF0313 family)